MKKYGVVITLILVFSVTVFSQKDNTLSDIVNAFWDVALKKDLKKAETFISDRFGSDTRMFLEADINNIVEKDIKIIDISYEFKKGRFAEIRLKLKDKNKDVYKGAFYLFQDDKFGRYKIINFILEKLEPKFPNDSPFPEQSASPASGQKITR